MHDLSDARTLGGGAAAREGWTLAPGDSLGGYRVVRPLGRGGMGEVYLAENVQTGVQFALKLLPSDLASDTGFRERFRREAGLLQTLRHEGIVQVMHAAEENGRYFLTMDYVDGGSLDDRLKAEGKLDEAETARIALELCEALSYAHGKGVIHRDIKPANVLLESDGRAKVSDFGLARVVGEDFLKSMTERSISLSMARTDGGALSQSDNAVIGTYEYMSPEQQSGAPADERSDIYSLGLVVYRLLTGKQAKGRFPDPSKLGCAEAWDAIVDRALAPEPEDRYASVADLGADVREAGEAVAAAGAARRAEVERREQEEAERARRAREEAERRREAEERSERGHDRAEGAFVSPEARRPVRGTHTDSRTAESEHVPLASRRVPTSSGEGQPTIDARKVSPPSGRSRKGLVAVIMLLVLGGGVTAAVMGVLTQHEAERQQIVPVEAPDEFLSDADGAAGHHYRLFAKPMKWFDACRFCMGAGGHLATIASPEENAFVSVLAADAGGPAWIGLTDERVGGDWRWVTGEEGTFAAWRSGTPGGASAHWASIDPASGGAWDARGGGAELAFVCEWDAVDAGLGLLARYFKGGAFDDLITQRVDPRIEISLGRPDEIWVRWTGFLTIPTDGSYLFRTVGGGGVRLRIGDEKVIDRWTGTSDEETGAADLKRGRSALCLEWAKGRGPGAMALSWARPGMPMGIIPENQLHTPTSGADAQ